MIATHNPDIVYLPAESGEVNKILKYQRYNVRIENMQNAAITDKIPQNSISQIGTAKFDELKIQNVCFNIENEEAIIDMIQQQKIINFPTQVFRTQSSNFPFSGFDKGKWINLKPYVILQHEGTIYDICYALISNMVFPCIILRAQSSH
ncbi:MAG: hypothetical protein EZS28_033532 [Streblomastix strix]|uniref:Uncharacterized protein n=1 Tax=Streblomastix strix TaxID=222440 RepID=A0A5J4ULL3_9EUKA|nr:MAG: hypothetical protein EZS28_033532 [Streblomastix strix]